MVATSSGCRARSMRCWRGLRSDSDPVGKAVEGGWPRPLRIVRVSHENAYFRAMCYWNHTTMVVEPTVGDFLAQHASHICTFLAGLVGGGAGGSLLTLRITRQNKVRGSGSIVDQNRARAGGDIVGGNKTVSGGPGH